MTTFTAKSVVVDCADNYGYSQMSIRSIDFYLNGNLTPVTAGTFAAYGTSRYSTSYSYEMIFNTTLSKTGLWQNTTWVTNSTSNQRVIIVFNTPISFDQVVVNNGHSSGTVTNSGVKNVTIKITDDTITNVTYNASVSNSYLLFDGVFDQHIAQDIVDNKTLSLILPVSTETIIRLLIQPYSIEGTLCTLIDQSYHLLAPYLAKLDQLYGLQLLALLAQHYGDLPVRRALLDQYWGSAIELKKILREVYSSNPVVRNTLTESYNLLTALLSRLDAKYSLIGDQLVNYIDITYALNDSNKLLSALRERYAISLGGTSGQILASVNIAGNIIASEGFNLTYSMDEYCGSCDITINNEQSWESINYLDLIILTLESNTYNFVVVEKYRAELPGKPVFKIRGRSHSITLDFPHAAEIKDDSLVNGLCSDVVDAIAGISGKTIDWHIPADESITAKDVQIAGLSPMGAIKKIVNEFRAIVQTSPDGTIKAMPSHNINTNKYNVSAITTIIDTIKEVPSCEWSSEKRQGYNKYFVANQGATNGYNLDSKAISETVDHIMASIVPWTNKPVYLTTSELTNVQIEAKGIVEEAIEEEVEIRNGSGKLQKPWYGTISIDYGTRINLGNPTFVEDGSLSISSLASSMAVIKYKTRYWLWVVTGTDRENVQYILMSY